MDRRGFLTMLGVSSIAGCFGGETVPDPTPSDGQTVSPSPTQSTGPEVATAGTESRTASPTPAIVESLPTPTLGMDSAPVSVMAFEDFACPHCRKFSLEILPQLVSDYVKPGTVQFEHYDYPLPVSEWSWPVANAARAIQDATDDITFFAYATVLYKHQSEYTYELLGALADEVDVNPDRVMEAAKVGRYRPVLKADRQLAQELNARGTPEVYVNDKRVPDWRYETIQAAIAAAVEQSETPN